MNHYVNESLKLLKSRKYSEIIFRVLQRIPHSFFRYDKFHIMHCREIRNLRLFRPLGKNYRVVVEKFNYGLLERIKKEMPHDMGTVYYRARDREGKTHAIYIEHFNRIVSVTYVLFDHRYISPSGFSMLMDRDIAQVYGAYVKPEYRLKGLHLNLVKTAYELSHSADETGLYSEVHYMNKLSFHSYNKVGFDLYRTVKYFQFFGHKFFF